MLVSFVRGPKRSPFSPSTSTIGCKHNHERMLSQRLNYSVPVFPSELPIQCVVKCFHMDFRKHRGYFNHLLPPEIPPFPACHRMPVWLPRACGGLVCGIVADVHNKMTGSSQKQDQLQLCWINFVTSGLFSFKCCHQIAGFFKMPFLAIYLFIYFEVHPTSLSFTF